MAEQFDPYEILELDDFAEEVEIKSAYKKKATEFHPDKNPDAGATEQFQKVGRAFAILSDSTKRLVYDNLGYEKLVRFESEDQTVVYEAQMLKNDGQAAQIRGFVNLVKDILPENFSYGEKLDLPFGWHGALSSFVLSNLATVPHGLTISDKNKQWVFDLNVYVHCWTALNLGSLKPLVAISAPTGSGKTIGTVAAIIEKSKGKQTRIVLIVPTRAIAREIESTLRQLYRGFGNYFIGIATRDDQSYKVGKTCCLIVTHDIASVLLRNAGAQGFTHILLDEVHNRSLDTDFMIEIFKNEITKKSKCKVFFMSACARSIDKIVSHVGANRVTRFNVKENKRKHQIEVTHWADLKAVTNNFAMNFGFLFGLEKSIKKSKEAPVEPGEEMNEDFFSKDNIVSRVMDIVHFILKSGDLCGDILIFVPEQNMMRLIRQDIINTYGEQAYVIIQLYGQIDEDARLHKVLPKRKIIVSTNFAESGMTFEGLKFVIDTLVQNKRGAFKNGGFVSKTQRKIGAQNLQMRMGRVGRMFGGYYIDTAYSTTFHEIASTAPEPQAEGDSILQHLLMLAKSSYTPTTVFNYIDPLPETIYYNAVLELLELGCVGRVEDGNIMLTEMGEFVAEFPLLEPALSLLIASGTVFNRQNSMRMLAAALMIDPPLVQHKRKKNFDSFYNHNANNGSKCEHMAIIQAVEYVKTMRPQLKSMSKNDEERRVKQEELTKLTNSKAYDQMTEKLERIDMTMNRLKLKEKDFADESFSVNNDTASLICIVIAFGAHYGRTAVIDSDAVFITPNNEKFFAESVTTREASSMHDIAVFYHMERFSDNRPHAPVTVVGDLFFICFAMTNNDVYYENGKLVLSSHVIPKSNWLQIPMEKKVFKCVVKIRSVVNNMLLFVTSPSAAKDAVAQKLIEIGRLLRNIDLH